MKKELSLGKVAYNGKTKSNEVTLELRIETKKECIDWDTLKPIKNVTELAISGNIWNSKKTDIYSGGQNLDTISEFIKTKEFNRIKSIWEEYHLNDMKAGTKAQTEAIRKWEAKGNKYDYTNACNHLKKIGLLNDRGYQYGTGWLCQQIPSEVIKEIETLFQLK